MESVIIRSAVCADLEQIIGIDLSTRNHQSRRALVESAIGRGECLMALDNGLLLGYGLMNYGFFNRGFVALIWVDVAHRRRGVATALFDEFERRCQSSRIFSSANRSNLATCGFLTSRSYVLSGMVQDLDEDDPEMFYSKKLR